ncbi:MAG: GNAT family N-acetyltransferase [Candidatus Heimdallarchaeaceae archaeon]
MVLAFIQISRVRVGYATESCKATLDDLFKALDAVLVTAGTAKINEPSRKLLERLGFNLVGDKIISFRKDEEGNPIKFVGLDYMLSKK